jgi:hypothetical protein
VKQVKIFKHVEQSSIDHEQANKNKKSKKCKVREIKIKTIAKHSFNCVQQMLFY